MLSLNCLFTQYSPFRRMIHHYNLVAGGLTLLAILVCFLPMVLPYVVITTLLSTYLFLLTRDYNNTLQGHCPWRNQTNRLECQVATLQHKIVVVTNLMTSVIGIGSVFMIVSSYLSPPTGLGAYHSTVSNNIYGTGLFKMLVMFLFICKIHHTKLLQTLASYYLSLLKHITIPDEDNDGVRIYPVLYVDGSRLSSKRYRVTIGDEYIGVTFDPSISMSYDSVIEYEMMEPDEDHPVVYGDTCGISDHENCVFRCQATVMLKE